MRILLGVATAAALIVALNHPAAADVAAFSGSTYDGNQKLVLTFSGGGTATVATNGFQGWVSSTLDNTAGPDSNQNYFAGISGADLLNNFFVFDLSGQTGSVTSAVLSVSTFNVTGNATWSLYDVSTPIAQLTDAASPNAAIFNDLGSGILYGSDSLTAADSGGTTSVTLDAAAVSAINAAVGIGDFAIGGTLTPSSVPEPISLSILGAGVLGLGLVRRKRNV